MVNKNCKVDICSQWATICKHTACKGTIQKIISEVSDQ